MAAAGDPDGSLLSSTLTIPARLSAPMAPALPVPSGIPIINTVPVPVPAPRDTHTGQPRSAPPGHEKLTITTSSAPERKQDWPRPSPERPPLTPGNNSYSAENPHKRKRSASVTAPPPPVHPDAHKQTADTARELPLTATPRDPYTADSRYAPYFGDERDPPSAAPDLWSAQQYAAVSQMNADDRLRDALTQNLEPQSAYERDPPSPSTDDRGPYPPGDRRDLPGQADAKKRKRNFSNRTKTGCMTCRRRKKKCDETQPECE